MNLQALRLTLSLTGMLLAIAAIAFDERLLIWAAIGVLALSVIVRMVMRRGSTKGAASREDDSTTD